MQAYIQSTRTENGEANHSSDVHFVTENENLDDWFTTHRSITLIDFQIDAQNSYLFTYNTFI